MSTVIQTIIHYTFANDRLLYSAFQSAHRDRDNDSFDDGNRGLAHYGILAIQMAETYDVIVVKRKTLHDFHTRDHWSKSKKGRAGACRSLGIEPLILPSIRQQHQSLSDTVLDNALSALLGAIWLDCEGQGRTTAATRQTIWEVLRSIDAILDAQSFIPEWRTQPRDPVHNQSDEIFGNSVPHDGTVELVPAQGLDQVETSVHNWLEQFDGVSTTIPNPGGLFSESQEFAVANECIPGLGEYTAMGFNEGPLSLSIHQSDVQFQELRQLLPHHGIDYNDAQREEHARQQNANSATAVTKAKRKRTRHSEDRLILAYQNLLQLEQEKLARVPQGNREIFLKFLEHRELGKLERETQIIPQFFYLAIGSWQTISDFRDLLRLARSTPGLQNRLSISLWTAAETYNEICRLDQEEALNVLLRRYHTTNLCAEEQLSNDRYSQIIVETPRTVGVAGRANAGNPVFIQDAIQTDLLLFKIMPDAQPGSVEFQKARRRVKRLRKLARYLRVLVKSYGFGILALLPSGPSFGELSLTDSMLMSMTETSFESFTRLLNQEQGALLQGLSRAIEPSLLALVNGSIENDTVHLVESIDPSAFNELPKGLLHLS